MLAKGVKIERRSGVTFGGRLTHCQTPSLWIYSAVTFPRVSSVALSVRNLLVSFISKSSFVLSGSPPDIEVPP
jgi:hypothetical protein